MLVREDKRITADEILRHPWVRQVAPATPLPTPDLLRQKFVFLSESGLNQTDSPYAKRSKPVFPMCICRSAVEDLSSLASKANKQNRRIDHEGSTGATAPVPVPMAVGSIQNAGG